MHNECSMRTNTMEQLMVCLLLIISHLGTSSLAFVLNHPTNYQHSRTKNGFSYHESNLPLLFLSTTNSNNISAESDATSFKDENARRSAISTDLSMTQEESLDLLLNEALFRMSFFMETDYLLKVENIALRSLFQTCIDSVYIDDSTIPQAGRGLFAKRDITKGTIVAFYPVDCIGLKLGSGKCNSVQLVESKDGDGTMIDVERSSYALFSLVNRDLCGVDLQKEFNDHNSRLFVDMNPKKSKNEGWYCGFINDAAIVRYQGDLDYYVKSRSAQNIEIVPFSTAPFQVGVTTKDVKLGEELFVSYGYNYWVHSMMIQNERNEDEEEWDPKLDAIIEQEDEAAIEMFATVDSVEKQYKEASWVLSHLFNNMNSEEPPSIASPPYPMKKGSQKNVSMKSVTGMRKGTRILQFIKRFLKRGQ